MVPIGTFLGPYFSGSIFSVLWVTFDPTSYKYADHQNRWIAKDSPHVVLGPYFFCRQGSLFMKSWVPMGSLFVFLSLQVSSFFCHWVVHICNCESNKHIAESLPWKEHLPFANWGNHRLESKIYIFLHVVNLKSWDLLINQFIAALGNPKIFSAMALAMSIYRTLCVLFFIGPRSPGPIYVSGCL